MGRNFVRILPVKAKSGKHIRMLLSFQKFHFRKSRWEHNTKTNQTCHKARLRGEDQNSNKSEVDGEP